jgi:uncharacterized protein (TIGR03437 family)
VVLRVKADGAQVQEPVLQLNSTTNQHVTVPVSLGDASDQVFLILFGTGFRNRCSLSNVSATIGNVNAEVTFAGPHGTFVGLDQANVRISAQPSWAWRRQRCLEG